MRMAGRGCIVNHLVNSMMAQWAGLVRVDNARYCMPDLVVGFLPYASVWCGRDGR